MAERFSVHYEFPEDQDGAVEIRLDGQAWVALPAGSGFEAVHICDVMNELLEKISDNKLAWLVIKAMKQAVEAKWQQ